MKWVYLAAACVVFFGALMGFILPTLISTKSDIAVLVGGGVGILVFLGTVHVVTRYFIKDKAMLRREVAMLHDALDAAIPEDTVNQDEMGGCIFCGKALGKHGYGYATNDPKDHEEDCAWIHGKRVLQDTKATAEAYEKEVAAKALEEAACWFDEQSYTARDEMGCVTDFAEDVLRRRIATITGETK